MPYSPPEQWQHGDYPTAAKINKYKSGLDAIYALSGSYQMNMPAAARLASVQGYWLIHRLRWLLFLGSGRIEDPAGVEEDVTLSGDPSSWTSYDLTQVEWLVIGAVYQVQAVTSCFEDYTGQ